MTEKQPETHDQVIQTALKTAESKDEVTRTALVNTIKLLSAVEDFDDKARVVRAVIAYYGLEEELNN